ncbi:non-canonical purine NTP diphosphatase [Zobellia laminariae]|uniref:non-canonical purine NTP diphosphatase n=1 Tax=Zobellia laminariae TaxID=248906 RepID=UPI0026F46388|nr:non-canonical purine NTP diphosphatase [Zobellia laminariae]WKX75372.1 non-canonical purine NTP diphosphatase [Zobellia laminariae]
MKLVFATHNKNKLDEVKKLVPPHIELVSLTDIGCFDEIPETGATLEENAQIKADYVTKTYDLACFADDTGLIVDILNGEPGVYSARYAGETKDADDNMNKLLKNLEDKENREAHFKTVIALNLNKEKHIFNGIVEGVIIKEKKGSKGFGYDPIFQPNGYKQTFAELPLKTKNSISHRGLAIKKLLDFLQ